MARQVKKAKRSGKLAAEAPDQDLAISDPASVIGSTVTITVMRLSEAITRSAERDLGARYGLKSTDRRILVNLAEPAPVTIGELSRRVRIDKAWISRSLKPLAARKLISITTDPAQPRAKLISLTAKGTRLLAEMAPITLRRTRQMLEGINQLDAQTILNRMLHNITSVEDAVIGAGKSFGPDTDH